MRQSVPEHDGHDNTRQRQTATAVPCQQLVASEYERLVHKLQRTRQLLGRLEVGALKLRRWLPVGQGLADLDGALKHLAHDHQHLPVRLLLRLLGPVEVPEPTLPALAALENHVTRSRGNMLVVLQPLEQLVARVRVYRQRPEQTLHVLVVELGCPHHRQVHDAPRHLMMMLKPVVVSNSQCPRLRAYLDLHGL